MSRSIKHSAASISNKEFNIEFKGYSCIEVDRMLDEVIEDYQSFYEIIDAHQQSLSSYKTEIAKYKSYILELEWKMDSLQSNASSVSQVDVLKRLARLEQMLTKQND